MTIRRLKGLDLSQSSRCYSMRFNLVLILTLFTPFWSFSQTSFANSKKIFYQIKPGTKSIMQVARDVYGDEKIWKDIVLWNEIEAPYPIHAGQIISLHRVDNLKYKVTEKAPFLAMIALENYGNIKMMDLIAQWNGLSTQEKLKKGQILILKRPPTLFLKDRTAMLIKIWKKLNRNDIVAQIENESKPINRSVGLIDESRKNPFEKAELPKQSQALVPTENFTPQESRKPAEFKESSHESYWLGDDAPKIFKVLSLDKKFNP